MQMGMRCLEALQVSPSSGSFELSFNKLSSFQDLLLIQRFKLIKNISKLKR